MAVYGTTLARADDVQRLTWSITRRSHRTDRGAERAFDELVASCDELCRRHFPDDEGYDTARFELSGPVQGTRFVVVRGRLRVVLSVQRFERAHSAATADRSTEIRLVGSMGLLRPPGSDVNNLGSAGWSVAGCAVGTVGAAALIVGSPNVISPWVQAALIIPALLAWRLYTTLAIARIVRQQAALGQLRALSCERSLADALPRWRALAPSLTAERDLIVDRLGLPPFRLPARAIRAGSSSSAA